MIGEHIALAFQGQDSTSAESCLKTARELLENSAIFHLTWYAALSSLCSGCPRMVEGRV